MNRTLSSLPVSWRKAPGFLFLLAFMPAVPNLKSQPVPLPQGRVEALDNKLATKLLIHVEKPKYPAIAKVNFIQGNVRLEITVNTEGHVVETHVIDGEPLLAVAAIGSVRKWLYRPYVFSGVPVSFTTVVVVRFALHPHTPWGRFPTDPDAYLEKQVRPPEVIESPPADPSAASLRMKVLLDSKGEVLDATAESTRAAELELARKNLQFWKFRPARWGTLAVPWYIMVTVPLNHATLDQAANSAKH